MWIDVCCYARSLAIPTPNGQGPVYFTVSVGGTVTHLLWKYTTVDLDMPKTCWSEFFFPSKIPLSHINCQKSFGRNVELGWMVWGGHSIWRQSEWQNGGQLATLHSNAASWPPTLPPPTTMPRHVEVVDTTLTTTRPNTFALVTMAPNDDKTASAAGGVLGILFFWVCSLFYQFFVLLY
jgi:hypothetical protein